MNRCIGKSCRVITERSCTMWLDYDDKEAWAHTLHVKMCSSFVSTGYYPHILSLPLSLLTQFC